VLSRSEEHGPTDDEEFSIAETIAGLPEQYLDVEHWIKHRSTTPPQPSPTPRSPHNSSCSEYSTATPSPVLQRSVSTAVAEHAHCPVAVVNSP
jgi:hypothetical protein